MIALLCNDDGIAADGLAALRSVASKFFDEVWIVAPDGPRSQSGHQVTTDSPIYFEQREGRAFSVSGTPVDCVRVALTHLLPVLPDWILSGINHGGNLGRHDLAISGTVAAVREAGFFGVSGIAFSHFLRRGVELDWDLATTHVERVLPKLLADPPGSKFLWNVNLPHLSRDDPPPRIVVCDPEDQSLPVRYQETEPGVLHYTGEYHLRPRILGSDVAVCFGGDIAVSLAMR